MIGRAAWNNPWVFSGAKLANRDKLAMYLWHIQLFENTYSPEKYYELRKFAKSYLNNFKGAAGIRKKVMEVGDLAELKRVIENRGAIEV
jgi:tRNA-dihydrouridine synthase